MQITTHSADETQALGTKLAKRLQPGDVIAYFGDLGAGKTALTRGIAQGLGITDIVTSPTYTIVNEYLTGRLPLFHFDMYRLGSSDELFDMMLGDVGKWFVSENDERRMVGRIVGVRSCFCYDVSAVTFREDDDGTLHVEIPSMPVDLPSDAPMEICDQDAVIHSTSILTSNLFGYLFRDTEGAVR